MILILCWFTPHLLVHLFKNFETHRVKVFSNVFSILRYIGICCLIQIAFFFFIVELIFFLFILHTYCNCAKNAQATSFYLLNSKEEQQFPE